MKLSHRGAVGLAQVAVDRDRADRPDGGTFLSRRAVACRCPVPWQCRRRAPWTSDQTTNIRRRGSRHAVLDVDLSEEPAARAWYKAPHSGQDAALISTHSRLLGDLAVWALVPPTRRLHRRSGCSELRQSPSAGTTPRAAERKPRRRRRHVLQRLRGALERRRARFVERDLGARYLRRVSLRNTRGCPSCPRWQRPSSNCSCASAMAGAAASSRSPG